MSVGCDADLLNYRWSWPWKFKPAVKQLAMQNWGMRLLMPAWSLVFESRCHSNCITSVVVLFSWLIRSPWDIYSWFIAHIMHKTLHTDKKNKAKNKKNNSGKKQALDVSRNSSVWCSSIYCKVTLSHCFSEKTSSNFFFFFNIHTFPKLYFD